MTVKAYSGGRHKVLLRGSSFCDSVDQEYFGPIEAEAVHGPECSVVIF